MATTFNKGEWSEPYVLLKLLAEKKIYLGKENFEKVEDIFYSILKIVLYQKAEEINFTYSDNIVIVDSTNSFIDTIEIPISSFVELSKICLKRILEEKSRTGTFAIPEVEKFLNTLGVLRFKGASKSKNDITIQIKDPKSIFSPTLGFSIKSQLGAPSTLINASSHTNFSYKLSRLLTDDEIRKINEHRNFCDKFEFLRQNKVIPDFEKVDSSIYQVNLQSIDSSFDQVLSLILLSYYQSSDSSEKTVVELTERITEMNPLNLNLKVNNKLYEMMMKKFLTDHALGMMPGEVWYRDYKNSAGFLVVRKDGEILCYHFYFIKNFENYLFQNTKLETPSRSRFKMMEFYQENGVQKFTLNLQIRFIK